jgi:hypothetical protein
VGPVRPATAVFDDPADAARARRAATRVAPVRLDCEGHPLPGLAVRWSRDTSARFWTLELAQRPSQDRAPRWTASTLVATWRSDPEAAAALQSAGVGSVLPLDDRRLVIGFVEPAPGLPPVFADRALGVALGGPALLEDAPAPGDLRDAIDRGPDLVVTGDPDVLDYAGRRSGLARVALTWDRVYLLLVPRGGAGLAGVVPADTSGFRRGLAEGAVRIDARPAQSPDWADSAAGCPRAPAAARPAANVIAYPADDATARELAERLVDLDPPAGLAVRPLEPDSLAGSLRRAEARAFILRGPRTVSGRCAEAGGWPVGTAVVTLIETRRHAIVRRGAPPLLVEWDGAILVAAGDSVRAAQ